MATESEAISVSGSSLVKVKLNDDDNFNSGQAYVQFANGGKTISPVHCVKFKNYYVHRISVTCLTQNNWQFVVKDHVLMPSAHHQNKSESTIVLNCPEHFKTPISDATAIRIILYQPSPLWKEFRLDDIQFYSKPQSPRQMVQTSISKTEAPPDESNNFKINANNFTSISEHVAGVLTLARMAKKEAGSGCSLGNRLGRFDIDGQYDINFLVQS